VRDIDHGRGNADWLHSKRNVRRLWLLFKLWLRGFYKP
jgi:hypothetical protein